MSCAVLRRGSLARSFSRVSLHWRGIYSVAGDIVTVTVEPVTPHEYKP